MIRFDPHWWLIGVWMAGAVVTLVAAMWFGWREDDVDLRVMAPRHVQAALVWPGLVIFIGLAVVLMFVSDWPFCRRQDQERKR